MRAEPRAVAAVFTVLLHLMILFALVRVTAIAPPTATAEQEISADNLHGAGERLIRVDIHPAPSASGRACAGSSYVGVGVTVAPSSQRIILVGDDTPASRAGLQRNDVVLNPQIWEHAHPDGTLLRVDILRDGVRRAVWVRVGKICIG